MKNRSARSTRAVRAEQKCTHAPHVPFFYFLPHFFNNNVKWPNFHNSFQSFQQAKEITEGRISSPYLFFLEIYHTQGLSYCHDSIHFFQMRGPTSSLNKLLASARNRPQITNEFAFADFTGYICNMREKMVHQNKKTKKCLSLLFFFQILKASSEIIEIDVFASRTVPARHTVG